MSRLWPETKTLRLDPEPAELDSPEPWRGALDRFRKEVSQLRGRTQGTVILSNHFVRYAVVPRQDGAASAEEELALARFHFAKIHGERARSWEVRLSGDLACAIDAALLSGLKQLFSKQRGIRLVSVQPALMSAYNRARRRIPRTGAWLVQAEPERVCLARLAARGWAWVHNGRDTEWQQLIERERSRAGGESLPALVLTLS